MWPEPRTLLVLLFAAAIAQGCVSVHAPLEKDENFPRAWGELNSLGAECKAVEGTYLNQGVTARTDGNYEPVSLTSVLNIRSDARTVSLAVQTRKVDKDGDAFVTLSVIPDGDTSNRSEHEGCFCIKGALACTQVSEKYWSVPNFGLGGSQRNVYFSTTNDHNLVARLQNYHADVILALPVFGMKEPWARFGRVNQ